MLIVVVNKHKPLLYIVVGRCFTEFHHLLLAPCLTPTHYNLGKVHYPWLNVYTYRK